jgi:hypothetical protein
MWSLIFHHRRMQINTLLHIVRPYLGTVVMYVPPESFDPNITDINDPRVNESGLIVFGSRPPTANWLAQKGVKKLQH